MSQSVLSLKNATIYQDKNPVLTDVNIEVKHGEFLYLIGRTGSGKSSFLKTLYADLALIEGEGSVVDYDLNTLKKPYIVVSNNKALFKGILKEFMIEFTKNISNKFINVGSISITIE